MSTYSSNLKVQLIGTGEENNTWGTVTNNAFSNVFEQAIVGYATVNFATDANTTLTLTDGNSSQTARNLYLNLTSSGSLTTTRDLIIPNNQAGTAPIQKLYIVKNATTGSQSIRIIGASGTGITVPNGVTMMVYSNGTNVVDAITHFTSLTLTNALPAGSGGTGLQALGTGVATWLGTPSSANLAAAVTDETGSGALVFGTSPSITTPTLTTPRLAGSSTGYTSFASANSSATNYTVTFPAENMTTGFRNLPISGSAKTTTYALTASDVGKYIQLGSGGAISIANSVFSQGDVVTIINTTASTVSITLTISEAYLSGGATNKSGSGATIGVKGIVTVVFYSSTQCILSGNVT